MRIIGLTSASATIHSSLSGLTNGEGQARIICRREREFNQAVISCLYRNACLYFPMLCLRFQRRPAPRPSRSAP